MSNKMTKIARWGIAAAMMAMPLLTLATLNVPVEGAALTLDRIEEIIIDIANWLMVIGSIIAVLFLAWGGIKYMMARGDPAGNKEALGIIKSAVIGLVVVLAIGIIVRTAATLISGAFFT